jgi:hypothetical protein
MKREEGLMSERGRGTWSCGRHTGGFGPVSPAFLKKILELDGYALVIDAPSYWVLVRDRDKRPLTITTPVVLPRTEVLVPPESLTGVLREAGISEERYAQLFEIIKAGRTPAPLAN